MSLILNNVAGTMSFKEAIAQLARGAHTLSIGVSYVQMGGWDLLRRQTPGLHVNQMRLVCTDQMNITQPSAVRRAISEGVRVRNFSGAVTYHPKVILAQDAAGLPMRFLLGSANLSFSALNSSFEAGMLGTDLADLNILQSWFDDLFNNRSEDVTPERLIAMESRWRLAAARRTQDRLRVRRGILVPPGAEVRVEAEDIDTLEDIFSTIQIPVGLLNFDYAGNNIRNVGRVRTVLANWNTVRVGAGVYQKQRSELRLLGFADGQNLTALGRAASAVGTDEEVARLWCEWLQQTDDAQIAAVNDKLLLAKRVFPQFWRLRQDVRDYFLGNAVNPVNRRLMQTIELLCNSSEVVQELSLDDIRTLDPLLAQTQRLPPHVQTEIADYFGNKGTRSWSTPDRFIVPNAWRQAAGN